MAPEVYLHQQYDAKADVFSYGITLCEILTGKQPLHDILDPEDAADAALKYGRRPDTPKRGPQELIALMEECWSHNPLARPTFEKIRVSVLVVPWLHEWKCVAVCWVAYGILGHYSRK
jgi:serine/threonine protein kinase